MKNYSKSIGLSREINDADLSEYIKMFEGGASINQVSKIISNSFGLMETAAKRSARYIKYNLCNSDDGGERHSFQRNKNGATLVVNTNRIVSVNGLVEKCKVDLSVWRIVKYEINSWEVARKDQKLDIVYTNGDANGKKVDTGGFNVEPLMQVKVYFAEKHPFDVKKVIKEFGETLKKFSYGKPSVSRVNKGKYLYIPSIPDLHAGKLAWGKETGHGDYDLEIALNLFEEAFDDLISRVDLDKVNTVLVPIGNDLFNSDFNNTTSAGTPQDEDGRWMKTFSRTWQMLVRKIGELSTVVNVRVVIVSGNHDNHKTMYLGEVINAFFSNNHRVEVDNSPTQRKYYRYGETAFMWTHGSNEKIADLPIIMANESKEIWANCKRKEIMLGHFHQENVKDLGGCKIRVLPSLCPPDFWHSSKGYIFKSQGAQGFLYEKEKGLVTTHNFYVD